jgi:ATP-binding cassette subfamily G (WHITE) protein 2
MDSETSSLTTKDRKFNQNRSRGGSSEGGSCASIDIPSEEEEEYVNDFPDKPRDRVVSFEDEESGGLIPKDPQVASNRHMSLSDNLASTLRWQLANPLGTEGDEPIVGQIPPPMVLSFHDICLSVPYDFFAIAMAKKLFQPAHVVKVFNPNDYVVETLSIYLDTNEALGMNVEGLPGSSHAVVKQIMPKSWAHRNGVLPGDAVVRVGDKQVKSYQDLSPLLLTSPRPVLIEFLRRSLRDTSAVGKGKHAGLKPILKSVSGSTLTSVDAAPYPSLSSSKSSTQSAVIPERLPAMVCGIMGPSGAGKTSLLDCLAGRKTVGVVTGSVRINGRAMTPKQLRLLSGYVVQEDILPPMLSVRECLDFQARLRVPSKGNGHAPSRRVNAVLKRMKLVRNSGTLIGNEFRRGISGGEKRRVSVAIELLSEPAILFLDEPTTGQDSSTAVMLCKSLKKIARDGTTVVMSIHQPRIDIFEMMTQIVFMTREGRVAYCGPTAGLSDYIAVNLREDGFANGLASPQTGASSNPADELLDVMNVLPPQLLVDRYQESKAHNVQKAVLDVLSNLYDDSEKEADEPLMKRLVHQRGKYRANWLEQLFHLSFRALRNTLRNPFPFFLHGVTAVVAAITLGIVFKDIHAKDDETEGTQDRFGIMFFLVLYLSLLALTSLPLWREEQQLFIAERASGIYGTSSYVLASMIFDVVPYRLLPPIAFAFISYPIIGLNDASGHQTFFFLAMVATNLTLSGLCMLIGVLTSSNASANAAGSLAMLTSLLFCGYLLNKDQTPDSFAWLTLWSPGNYAYEALVYNEFDGLKELYITSTIADSKMTAGPFTGRELAHCFGFKDEIYFDLVVLLLMGAVYFTAILIAMKLFIKEQR